MNTATHTPTPWTEATNFRGLMKGPDPHTPHSNGAPIAKVYSDADLAFIVRACNNFETVGTALATFVALCDSGRLQLVGAEQLDDITKLRALLDCSRAALARAGQ